MLISTSVTDGIDGSDCCRDWIRFDVHELSLPPKRSCVLATAARWFYACPMYLRFLWSWHYDRKCLIFVDYCLISRFEDNPMRKKIESFANVSGLRWTLTRFLFKIFRDSMHANQLWCSWGDSSEVLSVAAGHAGWIDSPSPMLVVWVKDLGWLPLDGRQFFFSKDFDDEIP